MCFRLDAEVPARIATRHSPVARAISSKVTSWSLQTQSRSSGFGCSIREAIDGKNTLPSILNQVQSMASRPRGEQQQFA